MSGPTLDNLPQECVVGVLAALQSRVAVRAVTTGWQSAVDEHFEIKSYSPPSKGSWCVDFEINPRPYKKDLYCAKFSRVGDEENGSVEGEVSYLNWAGAPCYRYRQRFDSSDSETERHETIVHRLGDTDACALWRLTMQLGALVDQSVEIGTDVMIGQMVVVRGYRCRRRLPAACAGQAAARRVCARAEPH